MILQNMLTVMSNHSLLPDDPNGNAPAPLSEKGGKGARCFLNISNHPSDKWPDAQKLAAGEWAEALVDIPFPYISPTADEAELRRIAGEILSEIDRSFPRVAAVHLMGELTFTHCLVGLLQQRGIPVLASTTERIVHAEADGKKTSEFRFVRFRAYPR
jgi:hypothetical protein